MSERRAIIHDIGYARYVGTRRAQSTRYRVITRNVLKAAWAGWWKMKMWVIAAAIATAVMQAIMYFVKGMSEQFGIGEQAMSVADAMIPLSYTVFGPIAFILTMTVGASIVANDLRTGAFEFYFSRPMRPIDYVIGKVGGVILVMGCVLFAGPLMVTLFRVGMSASDVSELLSQAKRVPQTMLVSTIATVAFAVTPLAFSVISPLKRYTLVAWASFYLIAGGIMIGIAQASGVHALGALHIGTSISVIAEAVYGISDVSEGLEVPVWTAALSLTIYVSAGIAAVYWRVAQAQRAGLGGG